MGFRFNPLLHPTPPLSRLTSNREVDRGELARAYRFRGLAERTKPPSVCELN
jgi:hypothetical protein